MSNLATIQASKNEGRHHGPYFGWSDYSSTSDGITVGSNVAIIAWCVTFADVEVPHPIHTAVEIRRMATFYYSKSSASWVNLYDGLPLGGQDHNEAFSALYPLTAVLGNSAIVSPPIGYTTELWCGRRLIPDMVDVGGFIGLVEHRLVSVDGTPLSAVEEQQWVVQLGLDYWSALAGGIGTSSGQGRIIRAKPYWRTSFYFVSDGTVPLLLDENVSMMLS
jgi:hypothetical protein